MSGIENTGKPQAAPRHTDPGKEKIIKKVCADFEAMLTYHLLKTMRRTIPSGGLVPRSASRDTYEMMLDQHIADAVARKGQGMGLQKAIYEQIVRRQHKTDSSSSNDSSITRLNKPAADEE